MVFVLAPSLVQNQQITVSQGQEPDPFLPTPLPEVEYILPDLKLTPPNVMYIQNRGEQKILRFDTTFYNIGPGPMELLGTTNTDLQKTIATQTVHKKDGTTETREVGAFVYHPGHDHLHWHVDKYGQFQIYDLEQRLLAETDKFSFCIWDEHSAPEIIEGKPPTRKYTRCPRSNIQGLSVGWGDTYKAQVEGQEIDITGIPDGTYMVRSAINIDRKIMEKDYENNQATAIIKIAGNNIEIVDEP